MSEQVMVRVDQGKPLRRVALMAENGLIYVSRNESLWAVKMGEINAVGFPKEDVYVFDMTLFKRLEAEWRGEDATKPETWGTASQYPGRGIT